MKEINKEGRQRKNGHCERKARIPFTQTNEIRNVLDFCLTLHHQLGKVIQMNQLDATMIY